MKSAIKEKPGVTAPGKEEKTNSKQFTGNGQSRNPNNHKIEIDHLLPHDGGAEISLIEGLVAGEVQGDPTPLERARAIVSPDDFYRRGGGWVYGRMLELRQAMRPFTLSTLESSFENDPDFPRYRDLFDSLNPITGQAVSHFARIVLEYSIRRKLIDATCQANEKLFDQAVSVLEILGKLKTAINETEGRLSHAT